MTTENNDPLLTAEAVEPAAQTEHHIAPEASETTSEATQMAEVSETQEAAEDAKNEIKKAMDDSSLSKKEKEQKIKDAVEKYTLKVDGKEVHVESQEELVKLAQLGLAGHKRMQEAAKVSKDAQTKIKQAEDLLLLLKQDPAKVLMHPELGMDNEIIRKFAEEFLSGEIKKAQMTPEQRKIAELEEQLKKVEEQRKLEEQRKYQEEFERLQSQYEAQYEREIPEALQKAGLPATPRTIARVAEYITTALEMGYDLPITEAARKTKQDFIDWQKELYGSTSEDKILDILGEDVAKKIRKADLSRIKVKDAPPLATKEALPSDPKEEKVEKQSISEWLQTKRLGSWNEDY